jgi:hypothetical protein
MKVIISLSDKPNKRYTAIFYDTGGGKKVKTTHFGYKDKDGFGSTYIDHKNDDKKDAYIARHKVNEDFNDYMSAGSLSRYILWNKKTLRESISDYKRRFSLQ